MVFKVYTFFYCVFSALAVILLAGHAHGALCDNSPYKNECDSIVVGRTDPKDASKAACHKLIFETKNVRNAASTPPVSTEMRSCISSLDDAIGNTKIALQALLGNDYNTLKTYFVAAKTNFIACDDVFQNSGQTNPLAKSTKHLMDMASVGIDLAAQIK